MQCCKFQLLLVHSLLQAQQGCRAVFTAGLTPQHRVAAGSGDGPASSAEVTSSAVFSWWGEQMQVWKHPKMAFPKGTFLDTF